VNAGTVEFLVAGDGSEFYFLEFNTRLQVEHPVTECLHGIDLVALQLAVAEGRPLPANPPAAAGHAIEARLYAEDPADGFRPSAGTVHAFTVPAAEALFGPPPRLAWTAPFLRLDSGVEPGSAVTAHYDAMLAKVITWAPTREIAARRLATALTGARIAGPATNRDLLVAVLRHDTFLDGRADTSWLSGYDVASLVPSDDVCQVSAAAAASALAAANRRDATVAASIPGGWRNVLSQPQLTSFDGPRGRIDGRYHLTPAGITLPAGDDLTVASFSPDQVTIEVSGILQRFDITRSGDQVWVSSSLGSVRLTLLDRLPAPQRAVESGSLIAPMSGNVSRIAAAQGEWIM